MSVISRVRRGLQTISDWFGGPQTQTQIPLTEASDVVDEAILDPTMRMMLEQQQKPSRETLETIREIFSSPERFNDFKEQEKALLMRLGASERNTFQRSHRRGITWFKGRSTPPAGSAS